MSYRPDIIPYPLEDLLTPLSKIETIDEIYIFGSRAYNTKSTRSDLDVLIYAPSGVSAYDVSSVMVQYPVLDVFLTTEKNSAHSFATDGFIRRADLIETLDAILVWSRSNGFCIPDNAAYSTIRVQEDVDFKKTILPTRSESQMRFVRDNGLRVAFVIMPFSTDLDCVYQAIQDALEPLGWKALRADYKQYEEDVWKNIEVYLECSKIAIAVYDYSGDGVYNPNVSLEVGYMRARGVKICYLKDSRLKKLNSDLCDKLYKEYNYADCKASIKKLLEAWICDNQL